ncbi:MAG: 2-oxoglutarate dehydrogenase complex dihydrolipoyllysine-residue succinyltransferase [Pseudomonadota bacterium]
MDIKVPEFPESISEGTIAAWHKQEGESAQRDELLVEIETEKVVQEVYAEADGVLTKIVKGEGETVESQELIGVFEAGAAASAPQGGGDTEEADVAEASAEEMENGSSPAARKLALEAGISIDDVAGSGRGGRITKEDVAKAIAQGDVVKQAQQRDEKPSFTPPAIDAASEVAMGERVDRRVPMTRLRASIARRLVEAQHNAAMLTTFNEVDMAPVMALRKKYQDNFQKTHNGTRLGFMSFFVRACVEALKRFPAVNASIDGNDIVYHGYYDIGVAVSTERGLVVPVVREADALSLAQIEDQINAFGEKARSNKLTLDDMAGGTFTISNGGVFGSLMSTPILNAPQTGVLGMHTIQERPVVVDGEMVIRPMMYLALSYDHRLIDGREAVQFLVAIKGMIEDPARILLEL